MKILVVEDEEVLSKVLEEKLERSGYKVKVVADGEEALAAAEVLRPDVIALDLMLPKKNGFEVLEALKANEALKSIPVIVISNLGEDSDIQRATALGAVDYYIKSEHPINEIVEKVKSAVLKPK